MLCYNRRAHILSQTNEVFREKSKENLLSKSIKLLRFETVIKSLYCPNKNRATELVKYLVAEYFFGGGHETVLFWWACLLI